MIAVSGIGIVSALGIGVRDNLSALRAGRSGISQRSTLIATRHNLPVGELKESNEALCSLLGIDFDPHISRTALLGALAVREAMRDSGVENSPKVGFINATSVGGMDLTERFFPDFMENPLGGDVQMSRMHDCAASTNWIADHCGITGYRTTISTACSSAANAIMLGARLIESGILDTVIAGGTDALSKFTINGFKSLMILDGERCRPFDRERSGLNLGEGAGYIVLQRAETLQRKPYCYLAGYANANDAHHQTASSAEGEGDLLAMSHALEIAGLSPSDVDYINVHGTGTGNNDMSEGTALRRLWGENVPPFSSTKAFTGHTLAAAGGIEAVFSVLSIVHGAIWPNLGFCNAIDGLDLTPQTIFKEGEAIDCVVSNSFGFGGNCSSVVFCSEKKCNSSGAIKGEPLQCYLEAVREDLDVTSDIKELVCDAGMRRRMGKLLRNAVSTAMDTIKSADRSASEMDCIVTATALGCLGDSEKFLENVIRDKEELLNPTPFIQSTFNTVGGQIALLGHNHCYNMTYVNRGRSFEDAMLDAMLQLEYPENNLALCGAFDENITASEEILRRLGKIIQQDGAVFAILSSSRTERSMARISYAPEAEPCTGLLATPPAREFAKAVKDLSEGASREMKVGRLMIERCN